MRRRPTSGAAIIVACLSSAACVASHPRPSPPPTSATASATSAVPSVVAAPDEHGTTAAGASFEIPKGWSSDQTGGLVRLRSPGGDTTVSIVDVDAPDSDVAATRALALAGYSESRPGGTLAQALAHGWDERRLYWYTPKSSPRFLSTTVFRRDQQRVVVVIEGLRQTADARRPELLATIDELLPPPFPAESFTGRAPHPLDAGHLAAVDAFVEEAMRQADVPGASLALVNATGIVHERTFGVVERGRALRVGRDTRFLAGSLQKALTTLLLAKLVDEGRFSWTTPVTELYPTFRLGDADMTRRAQVKHLVCNCTGVPFEPPETWMESHRVTPATILGTIASWKPTSDFGGAYGYSNFLFSAAGYIAGHSVFPNRRMDVAFAEAMRTRVFEPLEMRRTTYDLTLAAAGDHASPHTDDIDGVSQPASLDGARLMVPLLPAGAAWTTPRDYARYLALELSRGVLASGLRYVSEANLLARRVPQVRSREGAEYGLGMTLDATSGTLVIRHDGANVGYRSIMFLLPEHGIGGVLMLNSESAALVLRPFLRRVLEVLFDGRKEAAPHLAHALAERRELAALGRLELTYPAARDAVSHLARHYENPRLGSLDVRRAGEHTLFDVGEWKMRVATKTVDGRAVFVVIGDQGQAEWLPGERDGKKTLAPDADPGHLFVQVP